MITFKKPSIYSDEMVLKVVKLAGFSRRRLTNRVVAKWLSVDEKTIRNWRKGHEDFDYALGNAEAIWMERISQNLWGNLEPREKVTVIKDSDGNVKAIKEQVLPTHNDIAAAMKGGARKPLGGFEEQERNEIITIINKRLVSGEIDYLDAMCECEIAGVKPPEYWKRRERKRITRLYRAGELTALEALDELACADIDAPKHIQTEANAALGIVDPNIVLPATVEVIPGRFAHERDESAD